MAKVNLNIIKNWFKTGLKPTQAQFWDTWDSFFHKDDQITIGNIAGLENQLANKASAEAFNTHTNDDDAHGIGGIAEALSSLSVVVSEILEQIAEPLEITLLGEDVDGDGNIDLSVLVQGVVKRAPSVFVDNVSGAYSIQFDKGTKILTGLYGVDPESVIEIFF